MNPEAMTPEPLPLRVSAHAEQRFRERHPDQKMSRRVTWKARRALMKHLARAKPIEMTPGYRVSRLMKWGASATYLGDSGWVFVVVDRNVLTCERQDQWKRKSWRER